MNAQSHNLTSAAQQSKLIVRALAEIRRLRAANSSLRQIVMASLLYGAAATVALIAGWWR